MISTKRQVVTEEDRYGGYNRQPVSRVSKEDYSSAKSESFSAYNMPADQIFANRDEAAAPVFAVPKEPSYYSAPYINEPVNYTNIKGAQSVDFMPLSYSQREAAPSKQMQRPAVSAPVRRRSAVKRSREDFMPSVKAAPSPDAAAKPAEKKDAAKAEEKNRFKVMLAVYVSVVLILAAIVIGTGVAITNTSEKISGLEYEFEQKNAIVMQQQAELNKLSDEDYIEEKAREIGMEKIENYTEVELIPETNLSEIKKITGKFHAFSEWVFRLIK